MHIKLKHILATDTSSDMTHRCSSIVHVKSCFQCTACVFSFNTKCTQRAYKMEYVQKFIHIRNFSSRQNCQRLGTFLYATLVNVKCTFSKKLRATFIYTWKHTQGRLCIVLKTTTKTLAWFISLPRVGNAFFLFAK